MAHPRRNLFAGPARKHTKSSTVTEKDEDSPRAEERERNRHGARRDTSEPPKDTLNDSEPSEQLEADNILSRKRKRTGVDLQAEEQIIIHGASQSLRLAIEKDKTKVMLRLVKLLTNPGSVNVIMSVFQVPIPP